MKQRRLNADRLCLSENQVDASNVRRNYPLTELHIIIIVSSTRVIATTATCYHYIASTITTYYIYACTCLMSTVLFRSNVQHCNNSFVLICHSGQR